jgi:hypothetical protein
MNLFTFTYLILQWFKTFILNLVQPLTVLMHPISSGSILFMSLAFTVQYGSRAASQNFNRVLWNFVFKSTIIYQFYFILHVYIVIDISEVHSSSAAARVRARVWSSGICGGQSGAGAGFLLVLRFPLPIFIPPITPQSPSSIIWGCTIGQKWPQYLLT